MLGRLTLDLADRNHGFERVWKDSMTVNWEIEGWVLLPKKHSRIILNGGKWTLRMTQS